MEVQNAIIKFVHIGNEGHGIPTCNVLLDFDGSSQSFGGYDLRHPANRLFIFKLLDTLEIPDISKLPGTPVRVKGSRAKIDELGHIVKDKWFNPETDKAE